MAVVLLESGGRFFMMCQSDAALALMGIHPALLFGRQGVGSQGVFYILRVGASPYGVVTRIERNLGTGEVPPLRYLTRILRGSGVQPCR